MNHLSEERKYRSYGFHLYLEMLSPEDIFFSGNAQQIILPAIDGSTGFCPAMNPWSQLLPPESSGSRMKKGEWHMAVITDSCVEIMPERVILLAASIERPEEIDINRALAAKRRAEERLRKSKASRNTIRRRPPFPGLSPA